MAACFGFLLPLLFQPCFVAAVIIVFVGVWIVLIAKRRRLSRMQKGIMILLIVACAAYYAFLLWCVIGFGGGPPADPTPMPR